METEITRKKIIVIESKGENDYKDLTFTDMEGDDYKISNKRRKYFEDKIIEGQAVQLNFAQAYKKEYIYSADLVKDSLPPPTTPRPMPVPPEPQTEGIKPESSSKHQPDHPGQEIGLWWKEMGEMIRAGHIKSKKADGSPNPEGKLLISAYYAQMFSVLGIKKGKED